MCNYDRDKVFCMETRLCAAMSSTCSNCTGCHSSSLVVFVCEFSLRQHVEYWMLCLQLWRCVISCKSFIENIKCWRLLYKVSSKVYALSFCLTSGALSNRQNLKNLTPCLLLNKRRNKTQTQLVPLMTIGIASMYMWPGVNGPSLDR